MFPIYLYNPRRSDQRFQLKLERINGFDHVAESMDTTRFTLLQSFSSKPDVTALSMGLLLGQHFNSSGLLSIDEQKLNSRFYSQGQFIWTI